MMPKLTNFACSYLHGREINEAIALYHFVNYFISLGV